MTQMSRPW